MSEHLKSNTLPDPCSRSSSGNVFSQLRHLASEVENGIEHLRQELDSSKIKSDGNSSHVLATNFLLHTKKDMSQLKSEAAAKVVEFSKGNTNMSRVHELMKSVVAIQSQRLENVESYLEMYGYKRPSFASEEKSNNDAVERNDNVDEDGDRNNCADDESDIENDDNSDLNNFDENRSPKTPTSEKHFKPTLMQTPKLEDFFKDLSEESIFLMKQGDQDRHENTAKQNTMTKENTYSFSTTKKAVSSSCDNVNQTESGPPEPPTLLKEVFTFHNNDRIVEPSKLNSQQFETSWFDSRFHGTPEIPKLRTQGFELSHISKPVTTNQNSFTSNADLSSKNKITDRLRTPEPPALLSGLFTFNNDTRKFEKSKNSVVAPLTTPETPKLVTPGFKITKFSNRAGRTESPDEPGTNVEKTTIMKTPEAPTLLLSRFEPSIPTINHTERAGRSARSLFNTPPMPELKSHNSWRNDVAPGNKENFPTSVAMCLPMPEAPKLLSRDLDFKSHFGYRGASYKK